MNLNRSLTIIIIMCFDKNRQQYYNNKNKITMVKNNGKNKTNLYTHVYNIYKK